MAYCANCGNKIEDDSLFCSYCGAPVEPDEIETEPETNKLAGNSLLRSKHKTVQSESTTEFEETTPEETTSEEAGFEETSVKEKKTLKGLIIAVVILGILVLLAISAAIVIMVKGYDMSDIDSIRSDLFTESTDFKTSNEETKDDYEASDAMNTDTETSSTEVSQEVDSIVEEEKWKPSSMEITIDHIYKGTSASGLIVFSYEGDKLKKVSTNNDVVDVEYDTEGNCINYYNWREYGDSIVLDSYKYFYDDNNFVIKDERPDYIYSIYQNDVNGNHIHMDYYFYYSGFSDEPILYWSEDSTYDERNRLITTYRYDTDGWITDFTCYYTGTNTEPDYIEGDMNKEPHSVHCLYRFTYEYDDSGRITEKVSYFYGDDELAEITTYRYYYD